MSAVKQLMVVIRTVPILMVHILAVVILVTVLEMMDSPAMVLYILLLLSCT